MQVRSAQRGLITETKGNLLTASFYYLVLLSALPPVFFFAGISTMFFLFPGITIAIIENYCFANYFGKYIRKSLVVKIAAMADSCH